MDAFVTTDSGSARIALQDAAIPEGRSRAISALAMKTLPISVVGSLPVEGMVQMFGKLKKQAINGHVHRSGA